jgi:hypothetical protein
MQLQRLLAVHLVAQKPQLQRVAQLVLTGEPLIKTNQALGALVSQSSTSFQLVDTPPQVLQISLAKTLQLFSVVSWVVYLTYLTQSLTLALQDKVLQNAGLTAKTCVSLA